MRTNLTTISKRFLMALGVLAFGLSGQAVLAGDYGSDSSNAYGRYGLQDDMALIDAVNRDHPPAYSRLNGSGQANPYLRYNDSEDMALIDAVNANRQPHYSVLNGTGPANPYLRYNDSEDMALIDAINHDGLAARPATVVVPSAPAYAIQAAPAADGSLAQSYQVEVNG